MEAKDETIVFDARGVVIEIPYTQIKKANLETDFNSYQPDLESDLEPDIE